MPVFRHHEMQLIDMKDKRLGIVEGWAAAAGLVVLGLVIQLIAGPIRWDVFAWPVNIIAVVLFVAAGVCVFLFRKKSRVLEFLGTMQAAVPAMTAAIVLTIIMGVTRQVPPGMKAPDPFGFRSMLTSWPFVLVYTYMEVIVFQAILKEITCWRWKAFPALVFHAGLFTVLLAGAMGSPDMAMLEMDVNKNAPQWSAMDEMGRSHEVPLGIQLLDFDIKEAPRIRFEADIQVFTKSGGESRTTLAVNEPYKIDGWKVYLADYDTSMGRLSQTVVLELVRDPWLPAVYAGIILMLAGAAIMLFVKRR